MSGCGQSIPFIKQVELQQMTSSPNPPRHRNVARTVLVHDLNGSMVDRWFDRVELRRHRLEGFSVWRTKYGHAPRNRPRRVEDWHATTGLRSPAEVKDAVVDATRYVGADIDWGAMASSVARVDWFAAALLARQFQVALPLLPPTRVLRLQRSLEAFGRVTLGVEWGYEMHELTLPFDKWIRALNGGRLVARVPFHYEGLRFIGRWHFDSDHRLTVVYTRNGESGTGWEGKLQAVSRLEGPTEDGIDLARLAMDAGASA